jgi:hypothetical protein
MSLRDKKTQLSPQQAETARPCFFRCSFEQLRWEVNIFRFADLVYGGNFLLFRGDWVGRWKYFIFTYTISGSTKSLTIPENGKILISYQ